MGEGSRTVPAPFGTVSKQEVCELQRGGNASRHRPEMVFVPMYSSRNHGHTFRGVLPEGCFHSGSQCTGTGFCADGNVRSSRTPLATPSQIAQANAVGVERCGSIEPSRDVNLEGVVHVRLMPGQVRYVSDSYAPDLYSL